MISQNSYFYKNKKLEQSSYKNSKIGLFLCGVISGLTATIITYPFEFIRTRMAME